MSTRTRVRDPVVSQLFAVEGVISGIAEAVGISRQGVWKWRRIPARHLGPVRKLTGLTYHQLRPDLFPTQEEVAMKAHKLDADLEARQ